MNSLRVSISLCVISSIYLYTYSLLHTGASTSCSSLPNGRYELQLDEQSQIYEVYCHMKKLDVQECDGGGWTLIMKTNENTVGLYVFYDIQTCGGCDSLWA